MKPNTSVTTKTQWQEYCRLEGLPETAPHPYRRSLEFTFGLRRFWKGLLSLLVDELVEEQRVDYLERCWSDPSASSKTKSLKQLCVLMDMVPIDEKRSTSKEPDLNRS